MAQGTDGIYGKCLGGRNQADFGCRLLLTKWTIESAAPKMTKRWASHLFGLRIYGCWTTVVSRAVSPSNHSRLPIAMATLFQPVRRSFLSCSGSAA